jgi:hypothetical protein
MDIVLEFCRHIVADDHRSMIVCYNMATESPIQYSITNVIDVCKIVWFFTLHSWKYRCSVETESPIQSLVGGDLVSVTCLKTMHNL